MKAPAQRPARHSPASPHSHHPRLGAGGCPEVDYGSTMKLAGVILNTSLLRCWRGGEARPHSSLHYHTPAEVATRRARPHREERSRHGQQTPVAVA